MMTLLTIQEAATFLRLAKRTLYLRKDIPRVKEGHRILFIQEDLERWILEHREGTRPWEHAAPETPMPARAPVAAARHPAVDSSRRTGYHRAPVLRTPRSQAS